MLKLIVCQQSLSLCRRKQYQTKQRFGTKYVCNPSRIEQLSAPEFDSFPRGMILLISEWLLVIKSHFSVCANSKFISRFAASVFINSQLQVWMFPIKLNLHQSVQQLLKSHDWTTRNWPFFPHAFSLIYCRVFFPKQIT